MKQFNAERPVNSQLKFIFMLIWLSAIIVLALLNNPNTEISLHPWLAGIAETTFTTGLGWIIVARLLFITGSTIFAWMISVKHFEIPRKDYMLFFILPLVHFTVCDWSTGLFASVYWTIFLLVLYLLLPNESSKPPLKNILTAAICSGFLLLNGAFALLYFAAGIIIMTVFQNVSFRRVIIWIMGFLTPAFFVFFWYFIHDQTSVILSNPGDFFIKEEFLTFSRPLIFYSIPALLFILILVTHSRMNESKISVRRSFSALLFSLLIFSPAAFTSVFNVQILFSIYGLAAVLYWIKIIYNVRKRIWFIILWLIPLVFPFLFYWLMNNKPY